jgi:hypothetical protein
LPVAVHTQKYPWETRDTGKLYVESGPTRHG